MSTIYLKILIGAIRPHQTKSYRHIFNKFHRFIGIGILLVSGNFIISVFNVHHF